MLSTTNYYPVILPIKTPLLIVISGLFFLTSLHAADITAIQDGNWISATTWDLGRAPIDNDVVIIPSSRQVNFNGAPYPKNTPSTRPLLKIKIYGILDFSSAGNDKLYLDVGSQIEIFTNGKIQTTSASSEIIAIYNGIADNTVWIGIPSDINGPANATASSIGFANGILPVTLQSFVVKQSDDHHAKLTWITASEVNSAYFEIETFNTKNPTWQFIHRVQSTGFSTHTIEYSYTASLNEGENQFRLKQVDRDEKIIYSPIVKISAGSVSAVYAYYDPRAKGFILNNPQNDKLNITLYNTKGQTVLQTSAQGGSNFLPFNPVSPGAYILISQNNRGRFTKKILVQ